MKNFKILSAATILLAATGCQQDDLFQQQTGHGDGSVGVNTNVVNSTRGLALNNVDDLIASGNGFDLFAFESDGNQFMGTQSDGIEFAYNNGWDYVDNGEVKFWQQVSDGNTVDFYAVSPANTSGITMTSDSQTIDFTVNDNSADQKDLMYAHPTPVDPDDTEVINNGVHLDFYHALSQIVFKARTADEFVFAEVHGIEIVNLHNQGIFTLANAAFDNFTADVTPWQITSANATASYTAEITAPVAVNTNLNDYATENDEPAVITDSSSALLLLPQTVTGSLIKDKTVQPSDGGTYLRVNCVVKYKGTSDTEETTIFSAEDGSAADLYIPVNSEWKAGYKYTYTIVFSRDVADPVTINEDLYVGPWYEDENSENELFPENGDIILGSGTEDDPYIIDNELKLQRLANEVNDGDSKEGKYYKQVVDLNLSKLVATRSGASNWTPIGLISDTPFSGTYDGGEYSVTNLYINIDDYAEESDSDKRLGLFGDIGDMGKIKNLTVNGAIEGSMSKCGENYSFAGIAASWNNQWTQLEYTTDNVNITISIDSTDDFLRLKELSQSDTYNNYRVKYIQTTDVDLTDVENWTPIGKADWAYFSATYDGGNHKIMNLTMKDDTTGCSGLFGYIESSSEIRNVSLENVNITASSENYFVGCIAGRLASGLIYNCHVLGSSSITCDNSETVGGIIGFTGSGYVINCSNNANITGKSHTGGIAGESEGGSVIACTNYGNVTLNDSQDSELSAGGIIGSMSVGNGSKAYLMANINKGTVTNNTTYNSSTGGIIADYTAYNNGKIYVNGNIYNTSENINYTSSYPNNHGIIAGVLQNYYPDSEIDWGLNFYKSSTEQHIIGTDNSKDDMATTNCLLTSKFSTKQEQVNSTIAECIKGIKDHISMYPDSYLPFPYSKIELIEEGGEIVVKCTE